MLAQLPNSTPGEIGAWLLAFAAVVAILVLVLTGVNQWRAMVSREKPQDELFVTHAQFDGFKDDYKRDMEQLRRDIKSDMSGAATVSRDEMRELTDYVHKAFHRMGNSQQTIGNNLAFLAGTMQVRLPKPGADEEPEGR